MTAFFGTDCVLLKLVSKMHRKKHTELIKILRPLYAAGAWYFGAPKYPKRFVNPAMGLLHYLTHIKKTAALRFVFKFFFKNSIRIYEHKTTAFQVCWCHLYWSVPVFLIFSALGIDGRPSVKPVSFSKEAGITPHKVIKRCIHLIGVGENSMSLS